MLPADSRMRAAADFHSALRRGKKCGRSTVVVYLAQTTDSRRIAGFAVPKAVGGAVVRNRVKRRLRAIVAGELSSLPAGSRVVVRALPAAATASFSALSSDAHSAFATLAAKAST